MSERRSESGNGKHKNEQREPGKAGELPEPHDAEGAADERC